jgi:hypothetical protein
MSLYSFKGDAFLKRAAEIDAIHPHFLSGLMATRGIHRHAMWAVLSSHSASPHFIWECLKLNHRDVFRTVLGQLPNGFIGTLLRIVPVDPPPQLDFYERLYQSFIENHVNAKVLTQLEGRLTYEKIGLLEKVHPLARHPEIVCGMHRPHDVNVISGAIELVKNRCSTLSDQVISESLRESGRTHEWVNRMLLRHMDSLPVTTFPRVEGYRILDTGPAHKEAARQLLNCLSQLVFVSALGRNVFFVNDEFDTVVDCRCLTGNGLVVSGVWGKNNTPLSEQKWKSVTDVFGQAGISAFLPLQRDQRAIGRLGMNLMDDLDIPNIEDVAA